MMERRKGTRQQQRIVWLLAMVLILIVFPRDFTPHRHSVVESPFSSVEALAAAKNRGRGRKASGGGGSNKGGFSGFGAPPPTLEDVLANVKKTRFPKNAPSLPCPCGDSKIVEGQRVVRTYAECCGPLLDNTSPDGGCQTPLEVLQSRYTAFCYRNIGHIIRTTHEECGDYRDDKVGWAKDLDKQGMFDSFEFIGLLVGDGDKEDEDSATEPNEREAFLDFRVRLKGRSRKANPSIEGEVTVITERSRFLRDPDSGTWRYAGGDVRSNVQGLEDTRLNPN